MAEIKGQEILGGLPVSCGEAILILRRRKEWTQADLAEAAGLSRISVSNAERDLEKVLLSTYRKIFEALDCRLIVRIGYKELEQS